MLVLPIKDMIQLPVNKVTPYNWPDLCSVPDNMSESDNESGEVHSEVSKSETGKEESQTEGGSIYVTLGSCNSVNNL